MLTAAAFLLPLPLLPEARACDPAPSCGVWFSSLEETGCVELVDHVGFGGPCDLQFEVRNECDEAVEIVALECEGDCEAVEGVDEEPLVVAAGEAKVVDVPDIAEEDIPVQFTRTYGWSHGEESGTFELKAFREEYNADACKDWEQTGNGDGAESSGCQSVSTASVSPSGGLFIALLLLLSVWAAGRAIRRE